MNRRMHEVKSSLIYFYLYIFTSVDSIHGLVETHRIITTIYIQNCPEPCHLVHCCLDAPFVWTRTIVAIVSAGVCVDSTTL